MTTPLFTWLTVVVMMVVIGAVHLSHNFRNSKQPAHKFIHVGCNSDKIRHIAGR